MSNEDDGRNSALSSTVGSTPSVSERKRKKRERIDRFRQERKAEQENKRIRAAEEAACISKADSSNGCTEKKVRSVDGNCKPQKFGLDEDSITIAPQRGGMTASSSTTTLARPPYGQDLTMKHMSPGFSTSNFRRRRPYSNTKWVPCQTRGCPNPRSHRTNRCWKAHPELRPVRTLVAEAPLIDRRKINQPGERPAPAAPSRVLQEPVIAVGSKWPLPPRTPPDIRAQTDMEMNGETPSLINHNWSKDGNASEGIDASAQVTDGSGIATDIDPVPLDADEEVHTFPRSNTFPWQCLEEEMLQMRRSSYSAVENFVDKYRMMKQMCPEISELRRVEMA